MSRGEIAPAATPIYIARLSIYEQRNSSNGAPSSMGEPKRSIYDVTRTSTDISAKALVPPTKLPDTGIVCRISRATATGIRLKPPTLRLVGSKVIQPAPGTKTSAHAWVDPASLDPTLC